MKNNKAFLIFAVAVGMIFFNLAGLSEARTGLRERSARPERPEFKTDEIIVKLKGDESFRRIRVAREENVERTLERYKGRADVEYAEPNYMAYALSVPNDPYYSYQWNFDNPVYGGIHTAQAWDISTGAGVTVAVVDTGTAYENYSPSWRERYYLAPDLADTSFAAGYDFVNNDTHPNDDEGHGTHVAGTIAQSTNNGIGVAGVAYGATIMPIKVLDSRGSGTYADVADGIRWAADHGAKVINLSLGGSSPATYLEEAAAYAYNKGVTIVAAAGNDGAASLSYPAAYDKYVIAVGATRYDESLAPYSNYGPGLDLVAPGGDLNVDQNNDGYGDGILQQTFNRRTNRWGYYFYQGTSMASPHVAGVAALLISNGSATAPDDVRMALQSTAEDLGPAGKDDTYGYGLVDAAAALNWNSGAVLPPPLPPPPPSYQCNDGIDNDGDGMIDYPDDPGCDSSTDDDEYNAPPPPPSGEIEVFSDSFESGLSNWTQDRQNDWFVSTQRAVDGSHSAEIDGWTRNGQLISIPLDLQGKTSADISFSWYIERTVDRREYIAFDISTDGGSSWMEKARLRGNVDKEDVWHNEKIQLNNINNLRLRFRGKMSRSNEDADVDMVKVIAR